MHARQSVVDMITIEYIHFSIQMSKRELGLRKFSSHSSFHPFIVDL